LHRLLEQEIQLVGKQNVVLWGSRQGCAVALSTLLTWEGEPFAALVGMIWWLPLENWVWDVPNGDYSRLHEDGDEFHDIEAFWEKEHEDDKAFDWPSKAVQYFRFELFLQKRKGRSLSSFQCLWGRAERTVSQD
jgi:hypothetical protein